MTERTTDREALADEAQAGVDAVEAQREAEAARSIAQRALQAQGDIASMYDEENATLRADLAALTLRNETLVATLNSLRDSHSGLTKLESKAHAALTKAEGEREALRTASAELLEVADLRGDAALPHPEDDAKLWTARMQTAWDELRAAEKVPQ